MVVTLDLINKGSNVTLKNDNMTAVITDAFGTARASIGRSSGKWYYEITFESLNNAMVNVITSASVGTTYNLTTSRGYYSLTGTKWSGTQSISLPYGTAFKAGDTVGINLNLDDGVLTFYVNGVNQGVAFTDLETLGTLFPAITSASSTGGCTATFNFGATPFKYHPTDIKYKTLSYDGSRMINPTNKTFILHDGEYKKLGKVYSQNPTNLIENLKLDGSSEIKGVKGTVFTSPITPNQIYDSEHGYVASFNGINQLLRSTVNNLFPIGDKIIKYKIKVSSKKTQILMSTSENTKRGWFIGISDVGTLHYAVNITGASTWDISAQNGKTMICDNKWHELILEYKDGQYIKWYVDGVLDYYLAHSYKESTTATNNLVIGCRASETGASTLSPYYFEGQFTDLEIYKGELKESVHWSTFSSTLPNSTHLEKGMDNITPLLDRVVTELEPLQMTQRNNILSSGEIGKVFSKTFDLKIYIDIRSIRTEVR
ncbi:hypothetical protein B1B04_24805 [Lysinibacillus sp. KCTC 33748]|uniref:SPRY domain-containing protein n=1 Tax=unclassified Lysinibacillus TaxID=2636778 RepID=UPI0009A6E831|nr:MULTISPECIES: SPRY domain-containing protein [unclassified Lysinibacillus]OXS65762.1 hypothetical protein B1B04_24805 [Lysinibacillus sp. KCTC 33748]SKC19223.1 Concanavalin A-like lectin/glucanases superfamily protein [Lysinibacillus sp. AC-3]